MAFAKTHGLISCLIATFLVADVSSDNCKISWLESGHEVAESHYALQLSVVNTLGNLRSYFPNTDYDVTIQSKLRNHTFTQFYFAIKNENESMSYGKLELREKHLSMFHNGPFCINRIIDGPVSLAKQRITIGWQSPPRDSGCIELRAFVKETELRYHKANVTVCQDERVVLDDPGEVLRNCCACDDGKYELSFEGLWSRYTHPKHFPRREWLAVFPVVIGASHSHDYEFWHAYTRASDGLRDFATDGLTATLEMELKSNKTNISTLIKFRGVNFQNKTRKSFAHLRVDKMKHVVSLVARIDPSPDWFIGVSSLELCRPDCTWVEQKTFNMYAYDAGVKDGILYEDIEGKTDPVENVQSLNMTWPPPRDGIESPFYDRDNNTHDARPLARIHFKRIGGSKKYCQETRLNEDCVTPWSEYGPCSVTCGKGIQKRTRTVKPNSIGKCEVLLEESRKCPDVVVRCADVYSNDDCLLTEWSTWTKCSRNCGQDIIRRVRTYRRSDIYKYCKEHFNDTLEEIMDCGNPPCPDDNYECADERYENWSDWSPCSVTQGSGFKVRTRRVKEGAQRIELDSPSGKIDYGYSACLYEKDNCEMTTVPRYEEVTSRSNYIGLPKFLPPTTSTPYTEPEQRPDACYFPKVEGECYNKPNDNLLRYYFDDDQERCLLFVYSGCGGNENNFIDERECKRRCKIDGPKIDCEMSAWSDWSHCKSCRDISLRRKHIKMKNRNGGRPCPKEVEEIRNCEEVKTDCRDL